MVQKPPAGERHDLERMGTPTDLKPEAVRDISAALSGLLADVFALYLKDEKFSLAHEWPSFSGLSSSAR
jgi:starvation-inducible DNA-binding protein